VQLDHEIPGTIGCKNIFVFRNKAIYPVAKNSDGEIVAGFYARRSHQIVSSKECPVGTDENSAIIAIILEHLNRCNIEPYDEFTHSGTVRYIMIRKAFATGEIMVSIVINDNILPNHNQLIDKLLSAVKNVKDISIVVNCDNTNRIRGERVVALHGDGYITDMIGGIKYRISPLSFYQVNSFQTKVLYDKVLELAGLTGEETVFDLYCGVGTISLYMARHCKKVYGVESIPQAVADARQNSEINNIHNVEFLEGKAEEIIPDLVQQKGIKADVVIVDPPRKGCDKVLIDTIIKMHPSRLVYVSCDSKSLARDLKILQDNGYKTKHVQPVDMFPHTVHVETVALLFPIELPA
jgi:23S rRNA (uracil1939-C5)-methyltransferase